MSVEQLVFNNSQEFHIIGENLLTYTLLKNQKCRTSDALEERELMANNYFNYFYKKSIRDYLEEQNLD